MGTRGLTIVQLNNEIKVAQYGQWDHYPDGQGNTVLSFITENKKDNFSKFKEKLDLVSFASSDQLISLQERIDKGESFDEVVPLFTRELGAVILNKILNLNEKQFLHNEIDFINEGLFCEYAYFIDLDDGCLEVYKGFNKTPLTSEDRFFNKTSNSAEYMPAILKWKKSFDECPEEFTEEDQGLIG